MTQEKTSERQLSDSLKSPTDSVIPHPALDVEPPAESERPQVLDKVVFGVTAAIAIGFLLWGFLDTASLASASGSALTGTMKYLGWLFVLAASGFVVFALWLALGKYGNIPLGRDGDEPEFSTTSWVAMMFSAGMGIGLMFYGVNEPLTFFADTEGFAPPGSEGLADPQRAETAMAHTLFHWTLHPWAIYAVVGLAIAYGVYRKGRLQLISAAFEPLLGKHANGPAGKVIDILAIFATLFGSAASLGLGAIQIASGLRIVTGLGEVGNGVLVGIIAVLTVCFILSAISGVAKGIQWLSNINMVLALLLAVFVFVVGPTMFILDIIPTSIASYVRELPTMAGRTNADGEEAAAWLSSYTVFYWAWWISLDPLRRHVHRAHLARPHHPSVRLRRAAGAQPGQPGLVRHLRWLGHQAADGRQRHLRRRRPRGPALHDAGPVPPGRRLQRAGDGPGGDLLRLRRGRGVHRDGVALAERRHRAEQGPGHLLGRRHRRRGRGHAPGRR